ncbi:hypothetical protein TNCV_3840911 [Trichonephila clavipes]|nr:hypothetical protein TNCV_3840911 [Trichonephila clavipes]
MFKRHVQDVIKRQLRGVSAVREPFTSLRLLTNADEIPGSAWKGLQIRVSRRLEILWPPHIRHYPGKNPYEIHESLLHRPLFLSTLRLPDGFKPSSPHVDIISCPLIQYVVVEAHEINRGKGIEVSMSLAMALSTIQVTVRISSMKLLVGTLDGDTTYLHFHNLDMELKGGEYSLVPYTRDSAHKTFGPTDLTSTPPRAGMGRSEVKHCAPIYMGPPLPHCSVAIKVMESRLESSHSKPAMQIGTMPVKYVVAQMSSL